MRKTGVSICACVLFALIAHAEVVVLRRGLINAFSGGAGYDGVEDTALRSDFTIRNDGGNVNLLVGPHKGLLRFDLTSLTDSLGAGESIQIDSVSLYFRVNSVTTGATGSAALSIHQVAAANVGWVEGTSVQSNAKANLGESTWRYMNYNTVAWAGSAGCGTAGTDYHTTVVGSATIDMSKGHTDQVFNVSLMSSVVQGWIDNPANNAGLLLVADVGSNIIAIHSSESSAAGGDPLVMRPQLTIHYTVVPKPIILGASRQISVFL